MSQELLFVFGKMTMTKKMMLMTMVEMTITNTETKTISSPAIDVERIFSFRLKEANLSFLFHSPLSFVVFL